MIVIHNFQKISINLLKIIKKINSDLDKEIKNHQLRIHYLTILCMNTFFLHHQIDSLVIQQTLDVLQTLHLLDATKVIKYISLMEKKMYFLIIGSEYQHISKRHLMNQFNYLTE